MNGPLAAGFVGRGLIMQASDVEAAAFRLGVPVYRVAAILAVESSGKGFDPAGRPKILFEPHIFYREMAGDQVKLDMAVKAGLAYAVQGTQPYPPTSEANYSRLKRACLLDAGAAMRSASWGVAQVMGFNFSVGGYACVEDMVTACMDSEAAQFGLLVGYVERNGLVKYLQTANYLAFARGYNGSGAAAEYARRIIAAIARSGGDIKPNVTVTVSAKPQPAARPAPQPMADSLMDAEWLRIRSGMSA